MPARGRKPTRFEQVLSRSRTPLFLVGPQHKLLYVNEGLAALTGWPAAELRETPCEYTSDAVASSLAGVVGSLAPPPETWHGQAAEVPTYIAHRQGPSQGRLARYQPLLDASGQVEAVLGWLVPLPTPAATVRPSMAQLLHAELASTRQRLHQKYQESSWIGVTPASERALRQLRVLRATQAPVLVEGETGSGREHWARLLHHHQGTSGKRAFVPLRCRELGLIALKQAMRQAEEAVAGRGTEALQPGLLFFRDVDAMPLEAQQRLLELLQRQAAEGDVRGGLSTSTGAISDRGERPVARAGLRIVVTTDQSLERLVEDECFLAELYYWLSACRVVLPPLRERIEDLPVLAQAFLEERNRGAARMLSGFSPEVMAQFQRYLWPGNIGQLKEVVREACENAVGPLVMASDLPFRFTSGQDAQQTAPAPMALLPTGPVIPTGPVVASSAAVAQAIPPLDLYLEQREREHIGRALELARGNKSRAAELLQIPRPRLYRRIEQLGLEDEASSPT